MILFYNEDVIFGKMKGIRQSFGFLWKSLKRVELFDSFIERINGRKLICQKTLTGYRKYLYFGAKKNPKLRKKWLVTGLELAS